MLRSQSDKEEEIKDRQEMEIFQKRCLIEVARVYVEGFFLSVPSD